MKYTKKFDFLFKMALHSSTRRTFYAPHYVHEIGLNIENIFSTNATKHATIRCQFHQHFRRKFLVQKCFAQIFSIYILAS